jgi:hypothetical protein
LATAQHRRRGLTRKFHRDRLFAGFSPVKVIAFAQIQFVRRKKGGHGEICGLEGLVKEFNEIAA